METSRRRAPQPPMYGVMANDTHTQRRYPAVPSLPLGTSATNPTRPPPHPPNKDPLLPPGHSSGSGGIYPNTARAPPARSLSAKGATRQIVPPHPPPHGYGAETQRGAPRSGGTLRGDQPPTAPNSAEDIHPPGNGIAVSAAQCLRHFQRYLTDFEQSEILQHPIVYFLGGPIHEKVKGSIAHPKNNNGYDDDRGDYAYVLGDHLGYRYETLHLLGKGSFGQVFAAIDHKAQRRVAVKVIRNKKRFHQQALVEVKVLEHIRTHDPEDQTNTIKIVESFYFRNHLCITFEMLSINLYEFVKANGFQGLSMGLIRRFAVQLVTALEFTTRHKIVHCDLKPENILLRCPTKSSICVIDFGSSCFEHERLYTYIQSRFYRSPEVMLGYPYSPAIDMWSLGCILAELYTGYPLFPGENEVDQLLCIMEVFGVPPKDYVERAPRKKHFFDAATGEVKIVPNSKGRKRHPGSLTLAAALNCSDSSFLSFLCSVLTWDPTSRATPEMVLGHPWVLEGRSTQPAQPTHARQSAVIRGGSARARVSGSGATEPSTKSTRQQHVVGLQPTTLKQQGESSHALAVGLPKLPPPQSGLGGTQMISTSRKKISEETTAFFLAQCGISKQ